MCQTLVHIKCSQWADFSHQKVDMYSSRSLLLELEFKFYLFIYLLESVVNMILFFSVKESKQLKVLYFLKYANWYFCIYAL